ncbi:MAG: hypothetical protein WBA68_01060 [Alteraurantiacibacter sp.]
MTDSVDLAIDDDAPPSMAKTMAHAMVWAAPLTFFLIAIVVAVVWTVRTIGGNPPEDWWALPLAIVTAAGLAYPLWRWRPDFTLGEPMTPRGKRMRWFLVGLVVFGAIVAMPLILADGPDGERLSLFSNGPVPQWAAAAMLVLWLVFMPALALYGRRQSDDFAKAVGEFSSMVGFQFFATVTPAWWMGWRGGFLPEPQVMVIFVATLVVVNVATVWKRSHG